MPPNYLSIVLLISYLLAMARSVHVPTEEEGNVRVSSEIPKLLMRCASFALRKMAIEPDLVFKKRIATALKIATTGDIEKVFEMIEKQPQEYKDKIINEYLVDDCLMMRQYFIAFFGQEPET